MACPRCHCKVTYPYGHDDGADHEWDDSRLERCAACGHVFDIDDGLDEDDDDDSCSHGNQRGDCDQCDAAIEARGGIDKCLNCGRYKYGDQLSQHQVCASGCVNPNEY